MKEHMEAISQRKLVEQGKRDFEMAFTKVEGILREMPWVTKYVFRGSIQQAYVSRITPNVLSDSLAKHSYQYDEKYWNGEFECTRTLTGYIREKVFLLDGSGLLVKRVEEKEVLTPAYSRRRFFLFGQMVHFPEKKEKVVTNSCEGHGTPVCINNILNDLNDDAEKVRFILSYWDQTDAVIVYKVPNGVTLPLWIQKQIEAEQTGFKKECAEIDAEASTA